MILIDLKYTKELALIDQYRDAHMDYVSSFYKKNVILASGPYNNRSGGFIISLMSYDQAVEYMHGDPFYINNLADFDIKDFTPTNSSSAFKLFANEKNFSSNGVELFNQLHGSHAGEKLIDSLSDISKDFCDLTFDFAFGDIFSRNTELSMSIKELIVIAVCCSMGDCKAQIASHVDAALQLGVARETIVETLLLIIPMVGFPRVANTLLDLKSIFNNHSN
jgi:4-carboxymuconolactone decarboxylase